MPTVRSYTAERMKRIEDAAIVDGEVQGDNLILLQHDGTRVDAGSVRGPQGIQGPPGTMSGSSGSTDNVLVRADGTTGNLIQASSATLDDSGKIHAAGLALSKEGAADDEVVTKGYVDGKTDFYFFEYSSSNKGPIVQTALQTKSWTMQGSVQGRMVSLYLLATVTGASINSGDRLILPSYLHPAYALSYTIVTEIGPDAGSGVAVGSMSIGGGLSYPRGNQLVQMVPGAVSRLVPSNWDCSLYISFTYPRVDLPLPPQPW